jgi:protein-S-isoprenylcysteine O-methyltransferase Ste14
VKQTARIGRLSSARSAERDFRGLLLALVGSALARAEWRGILAVVIALWALWRKLRFEERWLREQCGESY